MKKYFQSSSIPLRKRMPVQAVAGVDLEMESGRTLGLAGESGCGKTTLGKVLLRLIEPTEGQILFDGRDILKLGKAEMKEVRGETGIVFQDPVSSLNPRRTVAQTLGLPFHVHTNLSGSQIGERVANLLEAVGLAPPELYMDRYPDEFSGGQRQRIGIARAIALHPKLIFADEPVSALDLSVRAQILHLMKEIQREFNLAYLFVTHDLGVLRSVSHKIAIMYLGQIVEFTDAESLYRNPLHPYTKALLSATPVPDPRTKRERIILPGEPPNPSDPPSGCRFHPRCPYAFARCSVDEPRFKETESGHFVACHLYD